MRIISKRYVVTVASKLTNSANTVLILMRNKSSAQSAAMSVIFLVRTLVFTYRANSIFNGMRRFLLYLGTTAGISLFMSELGDAIGLSSALSMAIGVGTGFVGILLIALAYPAYMHITKKERERIAPEIIRLTDELMK